LKRLDELLSDDPAWPLVSDWIAAASNRVEMLEPRSPIGRGRSRHCR
jgi:hypothetical protein